MKNLIFLTMSRIKDINSRGIYTDLLRKFRDEGYGIYIVAPIERGTNHNKPITLQDSVTILGVKTLKLQKTNILEKGVGQVLVESQYKRAIKKYFKEIKFDLILYSTPPITITNVIRYLKKKNPQAVTYLLLKDIFPQNAVDIKMFGEHSFLHRYFRRKETALYKASDYIGCMSPANVQYVLANNEWIDSKRVEEAPNSIELRQKIEPSGGQTELKSKRIFLRKKYNLPKDNTIFIYGGNLGKPQGIPFLIECLEANNNRDDCYFLVIGTGTEFPVLKTWYDDKHPKNVNLMQGLPKTEYDDLLKACDVGMIFLDHKFTIPNYPSRLLSYLENKMPVLCATDPNTDIGRIAETNGYGYWCESDSVEAFTEILNKMLKSDWKRMGYTGFEYLKDNYLVENTYKTIVKHV